MPNKRQSVIILGATGQVGSQLLSLALSDQRIASVYAPTRHPLRAHPKLSNPIIEYGKLPEADWWHADAVLCALGTTIKQAGTKAAFRTVDHDYVLAAAKRAKTAGCRIFVLNSSLGADASSGNFYLKVKGEIEQALSKLGFESLTFIRPSLLDGGPRPERRYGEEIGLWLGKRLMLLIPMRYRPVSTKTVAKAMLEAALRPKSGLNIVESEALDHSMGKS
jgi:uncharacterized protein YbjT (DUF2867 family)